MTARTGSYRYGTNVNVLCNTLSTHKTLYTLSFYEPHLRCRILFFPWKRYWATHSLLFEICGIFFFRIRKKKIQSKNFRLFRFGPVNLGEPPPKWQKNDHMGYIFEKIQIHTMLSDFFVIKMVIEDLLSVFFFPRKLGAGKKKYRDFHSLTPFLRFPS